MRTLVISRDRPYPPRSGGPLRSWQNIRLLATCGPVFVFSFGEKHEGDGTMPGVERWIHVSEDEYPVRALSGFARFTKLFRPRQFPLANDHVTGELNGRLRRFIDEIAPDVIVLSGWADAVPDAVRGFPRLVVDAHNIESLLEKDLALQPSSLGLGRSLRLLRFRRRERMLFRNAARIWVCSRDDAAAARRLDPGLSEPILWPNAVDVDAYEAVRNGSIAVPHDVPSSGPIIVYVGYYHYVPNARAADILIQQILPLVAEREPGVRLMLVGKQPTLRMLDAATRDPRITVTGAVDDIRPYLRMGTVAAVPLMQGGGTRLKILEAFAAGIPVVSTSKGAEGIDVLNGREIVIADEPAAIAEAIIDVSRRPSHYARQVDAALELIRKNYSLESLQNRLSEALPPLAEHVRLTHQRSTMVPS
jgi:polysaccharide biosynthesis protein PslH